MNICVCGWHFVDEWYGSLYRLHERFPVQIVANRNDEFLSLCGLPYVVRENIGLEFGAYAYYLENLWDGNSDVLFCHDDLKFMPIAYQGEIQSGEIKFSALAGLEYDQAYIFKNREQDLQNNGVHGRMIFIRSALLKWVKDSKGLWFDKENTGSTNRMTDKTHYNNGIYQFAAKMEQAEVCGFNTSCKVYFPALEFGYRGRFKGKLIA